jgi:hypothetical protein
MRSHKKAAPWGVKETLAEVVQTKDPCLIANPGEPSRGICLYRPASQERGERHLGVDPTLTLVANSRGTELERREVGAARLGKRRSVCPGCDSQEVDCDGCDDML